MKWLLISFFALTAMLPDEAPTDSPYRLLVDGMYHGGELAMESGRYEVLVLYKDMQGSRLEKETIEINTVEDQILDQTVDGSAPEEFTGQELVRSSANKEMVVAIYGSTFKAGPVTEADVDMQCMDAMHKDSDRLVDKLLEERNNLDELPNPDLTKYNKLPCKIKLGGAEYGVSLNEAWQTDDSSPEFVTTVMIHGQGAASWIKGVAGVLWAGDLDGDGKLDLLLDHRDHYNVWVDTRLYLSSWAKDGELVRIAASLSGVGC